MKKGMIMGILGLGAMLAACDGTAQRKTLGLATSRSKHPAKAPATNGSNL